MFHCRVEGVYIHRALTHCCKRKDKYEHLNLKLLVLSKYVNALLQLLMSSIVPFPVKPTPQNSVLMNKLHSEQSKAIDMFPNENYIVKKHLLIEHVFWVQLKFFL